MTVYGTDTPLDRAYNFYVRVQIESIDCYSVGTESRGEAEALAQIIASAEAVQETEVVEP
jgi:hypothetical protein